MLHDIFRASMQVTQPFGQVGSDQSFEEILRIWMDVRWILDLPFQNVLIDFHGRATVPERCKAAKHFEYQYSQGPPMHMSVRWSSRPRSVFHSPINRFVVPFGANDFWGKVVGRPAECPCDIRYLLGETKIGDFQVPVPIQQQVFGLQIPVYDALRMQVVKSERDFGSVELRDRVGEALGKG